MPSVFIAQTSLLCRSVCSQAENDLLSYDVRIAFVKPAISLAMLYVDDEFPTLIPLVECYVAVVELFQTNVYQAGQAENST